MASTTTCPSCSKKYCTVVGSRGYAASLKNGDFSIAGPEEKEERKKEERRKKEGRKKKERRKEGRKKRGRKKEKKKKRKKEKDRNGKNNFVFMSVPAGV